MLAPCTPSRLICSIRIRLVRGLEFGRVSKISNFRSLVVKFYETVSSCSIIRDTFFLGPFDMSAASTKTAWLSSKLKEFALDEEIYLNYIESVLDGEEDRCEKISALEAILGEVLSENEVKIQCMEIIDMYDTSNGISSDEINIPVEDPEETLVKMLENNIRTVVTLPNKTNKQNSEEEDSDLVKIRKKILSQYAQKEANSEEEECDDLDIEHNTNVSSVLALKKEQREVAKEQSLRKKEKDKEDREKHKQLVQEKKDAKKKKAQKVERKR